MKEYKTHIPLNISETEFHTLIVDWCAFNLEHDYAVGITKYHISKVQTAGRRFPRFSLCVYAATDRERVEHILMPLIEALNEAADVAAAKRQDFILRIHKMSKQAQTQ